MFVVFIYKAINILCCRGNRKMADVVLWPQVYNQKNNWSVNKGICTSQNAQMTEWVKIHLLSMDKKWHELWQISYPKLVFFFFAVGCSWQIWLKNWNKNDNVWILFGVHEPTLQESKVIFFNFPSFSGLPPQKKKKNSLI